MKVYRILDLEDFVRDENGNIVFDSEGRAKREVFSIEEAEERDSFVGGRKGITFYATKGGAKQGLRQHQRWGGSSYYLIREYDLVNGSTVDA